MAPRCEDCYHKWNPLNKMGNCHWAFSKPSAGWCTKFKPANWSGS